MFVDDDDGVVVFDDGVVVDDDDGVVDEDCVVVDDGVVVIVVVEDDGVVNDDDDGAVVVDDDGGVSISAMACGMRMTPEEGWEGSDLPNVAIATQRKRVGARPEKRSILQRAPPALPPRRLCSDASPNTPTQPPRRSAARAPSPSAPLTPEVSLCCPLSDARCQKRSSDLYLCVMHM